MPQLKVQEVVLQLKLVGLVVTSDLTRNEHVKYTVWATNKGKGP